MEVADSLIFSASGFHGFAQLGCLQALQERGLVGARARMAGSSAGAIVALLACLDAPAASVMDLVASLGVDLENLVSAKIGNLLTEFGGDDGSRLFESVSQVIHHYWNRAEPLTFRNLARATGRSLAVTATCVEDQGCAILDASSAPDMPILLAIRMSCSVPFVLTPVRYRGKTYIDGALTNYFPADLGVGRRLGVCCTGKTKGSGIFRYALDVLNCSLRITQNLPWVLYLEEDDVGRFMMHGGGVKIEDARAMYLKGAALMKGFLDLRKKKDA